MLTNQLLSYYNHLIAASIVYLTVVDPLKDIANTLNSHKEQDSTYMSNLVLADSSQDQDYYQVLGVKKDATKHEIHRAFRQLAKKYHPDKNKDKNASDEFIKIFKAYETLSDETKRKEYDSRNSGYHHNTANSWTSSDMNDFDINEFFKQYEDHFMRHAQHHQDHHTNHHQQHHSQEGFRFHGINMEDLFHDIDEDEFSSFGRLFNSYGHNQNHYHPNVDGYFGDGESFFGSHFPSHMQDSIHQYQHEEIYQGHQARSYSCQTIKKNIGGMTMTQTSCS